ncbi:unnamed protein product, partial [Staurois parvus]
PNTVKKSITTLSNNKDIIIKPADKGGGIVLLNTTDYIDEALRLLSDTSTYTKLTKDPLPEFKQDALLLTNTALLDGVTTKQEASFLSKDFYNTPYFYFLPKVHKNPNNPPGRPIVAATGSITSCFSQYIDHFLQPLAQAQHSYIRDSGHLLELLQTYSWEPDYCWVSLDVCSLYTSIPHDVGITAINPALSILGSITQPQTIFLYSRRHLILPQTQLLHIQPRFLLTNSRYSHGSQLCTLICQLDYEFLEDKHIWHNKSLLPPTSSFTAVT